MFSGKEPGRIQSWSKRGKISPLSGLSGTLPDPVFLFLSLVPCYISSWFFLLYSENCLFLFYLCFLLSSSWVTCHSSDCEVQLYSTHYQFYLLASLSPKFQTFFQLPRNSKECPNLSIQADFSNLLILLHSPMLLITRPFIWPLWPSAVPISHPHFPLHSMFGNKDYYYGELKKRKQKKSEFSTALMIKRELKIIFSRYYYKVMWNILRLSVIFYGWNIFTSKHNFPKGEEI